MKHFKLTIAALLLCFAWTAQADPIVTTAGCGEPKNDGSYKDHCVLQIDSIVVDSINYVVDFVYGTFADVFGSATPTFWGNMSGAEAAARAIVAAINGGSTIVDPEYRFSDNASKDFFVPYAVTSDNNNTLKKVVGVSCEDKADSDGTAKCDDNDSDSISEELAFATFTRKKGNPDTGPGPGAQVPEPGTLALLGLGLAGVGLARRRKQV